MRQGKFLDAKSQCLVACPDGFWGKGSEAIGRTCELCAENCTTCLSDQTQLVGNWSVCLMFLGFSCSLLFLRLAGSRCTECKNSKILTPSGTCDDDCPDGFYAHSSTEDDPTIGSLCVACPENCAKCVSPDHCTECKSATYLTDDHTCDPLCPDGFYGDGTADAGRTCKRCSDDCNRCASDDMCYECKNHKFLTPGDACEAECPEGYYADISSDTPSVGAELSDFDCPCPVPRCSCGGSVLSWPGCYSLVSKVVFVCHAPAVALPAMDQTAAPCAVTTDS